MVEVALETRDLHSRKGIIATRPFVSWRTLPLGDNDRVFRMGDTVVWVGIEKDDFG
jgi:hypothetical protein